MPDVTTAELLGTTYDHLEKRGHPEATVARTVAGDRLLMVELAAGDGETHTGVVHSPSDSYPDRDGMGAREVIDRALDDAATPADRALGIASLNALSASLLEWRDGDPMDALVPHVETIGMVGLFSPAFGKFEGLDIHVVERFPEDVTPLSDLPAGVSVSLYGPEEAKTAFADATVVYATGSTLIYGGLGRYLAAAPADATFVLIGSTASFVPDAAFEAGVDVLAGAEVIDPQLVEDRIRGHKCVDDLHGTGLRKGVLIRDAEKPLPGLVPSFGTDRVGI